jgi:hypothetical protein
MISDYRRVLYLLGAVALLTVYLGSQGAIEEKYSTVAVGYLLLLAVCGVVFLLAPLAGNNVALVFIAFLFFWVYVNFDKTIGMYGTIVAIAYLYWRER